MTHQNAVFKRLIVNENIFKKENDDLDSVWLEMHSESLIR